ASRRGKSQGSCPLSHVKYETVNRHYEHVDYARHTDYVKIRILIVGIYTFTTNAGLYGIPGLPICGPHLSTAA
ncbi:hypothetical protein IFM89_018843, partial [Coptis chinensis]